MKFRRYGVVFLVFIIGMGIFVPVSAKAARKSGMFGYELKGNGTAKITRFYWGANNGADIYVPRFIDGYAVTEIGAFAFSDERIVNVPTSLPAEGMLGEKVIVVLPDTITVIGEKAFFWTQITACNIPSSVHLINAGAFAGCKNIKQFTVDSNNTVYTTIDGVLYNKARKELVAYPNASIEWESVGREIWSYEDINIRIPDGIITIGDYAFYDTLDADYHRTIKLFLPSTLQMIGDYAFFDCSINVSATIELPEGLTSIGNYAFCNAGLYQTIVPNTLGKIGDYAFYEATICTAGKEGYGSKYKNFYSLWLPESVTHIGQNAFTGISRGEGVWYTIIDLSQTKITEIAPATFAHVGSGYIYLPDTLEIISERAFRYTAGEITIPASVKEIGKEAFAFGEHAISFAENAKLGEIGDRAFFQMQFKEGETIALPAGVKSLGTEVFLDAEGLSEVVIPKSVISIGSDIADRAKINLQVEDGSFAALWASENGYSMRKAGGDDTSWLSEEH